MKCVLNHSHALACGGLKDLLESAGIEAILTGEKGTFMAGEGTTIADGLDLALTEVWVNDEDFPKASEITAEFRKSFSQEPKQ